MTKINNEPIERVVIKLPKSVASYFREAFKHGQRSKFVAKCILDHRYKEEVKQMESKLRKAAKNRQ